MKTKEPTIATKRIRLEEAVTKKIPKLRVIHLLKPQRSQLLTW
jgi:hypothetical protein